MTEKRTSTFENGLIWFGAAVSIAEILTAPILRRLALAAAYLPSSLVISLAAHCCFLPV